MESIEQQYETGMLIFEQIFSWKKDKILKFISDLVGNTSRKYNDILEYQPNVYKNSINDIPQNISISVYGSFKINAFGINYEGEHGRGNHQIVKFDKFFKIPEEWKKNGYK